MKMRISYWTCPSTPSLFQAILFHLMPTVMNRSHVSSSPGTPPSVMFIKCEPLLPLLDEECTLNLCVKDFCPEQVSVTWFKDGQTVPNSQFFNSPPSLNVNGLYSMWSFLKLSPTMEDYGSEFRCRVVHSAQKEPEERVFTHHIS